MNRVGENIKKWKKIILSRLEYEDGDLKWEDVSAILNKHFDERFFIISK